MKPKHLNLVLTKNDAAFVVGRFKGGMNSHEIAKAYGYPESQVLRVIHRERAIRLGLPS